VNPSALRFEIDRVEVRSRLTAMADTLELRQDALAATPEAIGERCLMKWIVPSACPRSASRQPWSRPSLGREPNSLVRLQS
jgi:hypothetical protein